MLSHASALNPDRAPVSASEKPPLFRPKRFLRSALLALGGPLAFAVTNLSFAATTSAAGQLAPAKPVPSLVQSYCLDCHDSAVSKGNVSLESLDFSQPERHPEIWEKVIRMLDHRQMPPIGEARPDEAAYNHFVSVLQSGIDRAATAKPSPGRTDTFRRLNRTEYQNAIRDLLAVDIDAASLLPNDEPSHGFDNVTVGNLSPTLLESYVTAAQKIARLAVGAPSKVPSGDTFRIRADTTQEDHVDGLPIGTRGGALIPYVFAQEGDYEIQIRLARDRNEQVEGLRKPHEVEVLIDRERVALFTVKPPGADKNAEGVDAHLKFRIPVKAGPHEVGVTFIKDPSVVIETQRTPYEARFNMHRHPRTAPALYQVSITGPFEAKAPGETPSRRAIFGEGFSASVTVAEQESAARLVLSKLMRRAYRRPVSEDDLRKPMQFFREGSAETGGFEGGIENALSAVLVNSSFLFRIEDDPAGVPSGTAYRVSDLELASRLSFFLWSSLPDDALLDAAVRGDLRQPALLEQQVRRMLADSRSESLVTNFAAQWLHLRNLESATPDSRLFIDFDDNLRQAFRRETELFFSHILREDRPITELLGANYSFLNERLAKHYGVPHIYGSHFRQVSFGDDPARQRGGLLRHGSVLTVTSYATRTSPVIRGKWVLDNLLATPPSPPAPDVPALDSNENVISAKLTVRERLTAHRANPVCANCHDIMDPIGFALENFDAVGRWRTSEEGKPVDNSGGFADGSVFGGVAGLEQALLKRPDLFAGAVSEKLLIFALGRGVDYYDGPALRQVVRRAAADQFRFSSLILGIVNSTPFQMRTSP